MTGALGASAASSSSSVVTRSRSASGRATPVSGRGTPTGTCSGRISREETFLEALERTNQERRDRMQELRSNVNFDRMQAVGMTSFTSRLSEGTLERTSKKMSSKVRRPSSERTLELNACAQGKRPTPKIDPRLRLYATPTKAFVSSRYYPEVS